MKRLVFFITIFIVVFSLQAQEIPEGKGRLQIKAYNGIGDIVSVNIEIIDEDLESVIYVGNTEMFYDLKGANKRYTINFRYPESSNYLKYSIASFKIRVGEINTLKLDEVSRCKINVKNFIGINENANLSFKPRIDNYITKGGFPYSSDVVSGKYKIECEFHSIEKYGDKELIVKEIDFKKGRETPIEFTSKFGGLSINPKSGTGGTAQNIKSTVFKGTEYVASIKGHDTLMLLPGDYRLVTEYTKTNKIEKNITVKQNTLVNEVIDIGSGVLNFEGNDEFGKPLAYLKSAEIYNDNKELEGKVNTGGNIDLLPGDYIVKYDDPAVNKIINKKVTINSGESKTIWIGAENHGVLEYHIKKVGGISTYVSPCLYNKALAEWECTSRMSTKITLPVGTHDVKFSYNSALDTIVRNIEIKKGVVTPVELNPVTGILNVTAINGLGEETSNKIDIFSSLSKTKLSEVLAGKDNIIPIGKYEAIINDWKAYTTTVKFEIEKNKTTNIKFEQPSTRFILKTFDYSGAPLSYKSQKSYNGEETDFYIVDGKRYNFDANKKQVRVLPGKHTMYFNIQGKEIDTVLTMLPDKLNEFNIKFGAIKLVSKDGLVLPKDVKVRINEWFIQQSFNQKREINLPKGEYTLDFNAFIKQAKRYQNELIETPKEFTPKYKATPENVNLEWGEVINIIVEDENIYGTVIFKTNREIGQTKKLEVGVLKEGKVLTNVKTYDYVKIPIGKYTGNLVYKGKTYNEQFIVTARDTITATFKLSTVTKAAVAFKAVNGIGQIESAIMELTDKENKITRVFPNKKENVIEGAYNIKLDFSSKNILDYKLKNRSLIGSIDTIIATNHYGRLKLNAYNEKNIETNYFVRIEKEGEFVASTSGKNEYFDLPEGTYDLVFDVDQKEVIKSGITVNHGKVTKVEVRTAEVSEIDVGSEGNINLNNLPHLTYNGKAAELKSTNNGFITLTNGYWQAGSVFYTKPVDIDDSASFKAYFSFQIEPINEDGADGICFVLQTASNTAGAAGGGIGYQNIAPSMAVEFDTYNNGEVNANHVGLDVNGNLNSVVVETLSRKLEDGKPWKVWVDYKKGMISVKINNRSNEVIRHPINLEDIFKGKPVFVGFTSGTGDAAGVHKILDWKFSLDSNVSPIPSSFRPDGWQITGDGAYYPDDSSVVMSAIDRMQKETWYFKAPSKYLGNHKNLYDKTLFFKLKTTSQGLEYDADDIIIEGEGISITYDTKYNPGTDWTDYEVNINEFSGWINKKTGEPASKEDIENVLLDITSFLIRGEYSNKHDIGYLDDVQFK